MFYNIYLVNKQIYRQIIHLFFLLNDFDLKKKRIKYLEEK